MAILNVLRCVPDGVMVLGPPCASFVFINLGTSRRSATNPFGNESLPHVEMGSMLLGPFLMVFLCMTQNLKKSANDTPCAMVRGFSVELSC